jgi:nucleotide-binding universal stress UspA family protein
MAGAAVFAYDGSEDARRALEVARDVLDVDRAIIVHVHVIPLPPIIGSDPAAGEFGSPDDVQARQADRAVEEGVDTAKRAGFDAEAVVKTADSMTGVWRAIIDVAEEQGASVIVAGHRGLSRLQSALLGSVSNGLVNHAHIPVLVIPGSRR